MTYRVEEKLKILSLGYKYTIEFGTILYDYVIKNKPKLIVELGTGRGITTTCIGFALKENDYGELISYDYYEEFGWETEIKIIQKKINDLKLEKYIILQKKNAYDWLKNPLKEKIDMLYLDIHNDGKVIDFFVGNNFIKKQLDDGMIFLFEGGANSSREEVCRLRNQLPFSEMKTNHNLLYNSRTGLSKVIWKKT